MTKLKKTIWCLTLLFSAVLLSQAAETKVPVPAAVSGLVADFKRLRENAKQEGARLKTLREQTKGRKLGTTEVADQVEVTLRQRAIYRQMGDLRRAIEKALGYDTEAEHRTLLQEAAKIGDPSRRRELIEERLAIRAIFAAENNARIEQLLK
jgi:hypothetical protein